MDSEPQAPLVAYDVDRLVDLPKPQRFLELAKAHADAQGHAIGESGRVIADGKAVAQGWSGYARKFRSQILDWATRDMTSFPGFAQLLDAESGYYPTARIDLDWRALPLADAYDLAQEARQDPRRAFRRMPDPTMVEAEPEQAHGPRP